VKFVASDDILSGKSYKTGLVIFPDGADVINKILDLSRPNIRENYLNYTPRSLD
jgi:hypothetical protein